MNAGLKLNDVEECGYKINLWFLKFLYNVGIILILQLIILSLKPTA